MLATRKASERKRLEEDFAYYLQAAWAEVLEPANPLHWTWHQQVLCEHLQAMLEDWMRVQLGLLGRLQPEPTAPLPEEPKAREAEVRRRAVLRVARRQAMRLGVLEADGVTLRNVPQRCRKLVLNAPPGSNKTTIFFTAFPTWGWVQWPALRFMCLSVTPTLPLREADKARDLIRSEWYQTTFEPDWQISRSADAKGFYRNTSGGHRYSGSIHKISVGERADVTLGDDLDDPVKVHSATTRRTTHQTWDSMIRQRAADKRYSLSVVGQQRVHPQDMSGYILSTEGAEWEHLKFQQERRAPRRCYKDSKGRFQLCPACQRGTTFLGWKDTRKEGELLDPVRQPMDILTVDKAKTLSWEAGHEQEPVDLQGNVFLRENWRYWRYAHEPEVPELAERTVIIPTSEEWGTYFEAWGIAGDLTFKKTKAGSRVCLQVWAKRGARYYLVDTRWDRMSFTKALAALSSLAEEYPQAIAKWIERAANADATDDALGEGAEYLGLKQVEGIILLPAIGSKEARGHEISPLQEAGNVLLPLHADWRQDAVEEGAHFPEPPNDFVDTMGIALKQLRAGTGFFFLAAGQEECPRCSAVFHRTQGLEVQGQLLCPKCAPHALSTL